MEYIVGYFWKKPFFIWRRFCMGLRALKHVPHRSLHASVTFSQQSKGIKQKILSNKKESKIL